MLKKIFPFDSESSFFNSFKIIFLAEGYLASESVLFTASCFNFVNRLLETPPFSLTRINSNWLSVYASFISSMNHGAAINTIPSANRTAFESSVDTVTGLMAINKDNVNEHLDVETFKYINSTLNIREQVPKGSPNFGKTGTLFVLLLPALSGSSAGAEFEHIPSNNDYYFVATTQDGEWQQVIIRTLCKLLGLGDEFELDGNDKMAPDSNQINEELVFYPNVQYFSEPPSSLTEKIKWYKLFPATQRGLSISVNNKADPFSANADNSINNSLTSHSNIELWEGAGGYRTKVYRSAIDCLMRRRIGSHELPIRNDLVGFCPVCNHYIKSSIY